MKVKNILGSLLLGSTLIMTSCEDFTDLQPKGANLLTATTELEMLLNYEYAMEWGHSDWSTICGNMVYPSSHVPTLISQPNKTRDVIMITWDEANQDKMAELTNNDYDYATFYSIIGKVCNPVLQRLDEIEGDEATKNRLRCEALTLRAYLHYLLVNKYAKAYHPSIAAQTPGIAYMTEKQDITAYAPKLTVQEVYDNILADLELAIELDALPVQAVNNMRISKPCAYAAKSLALLSMQRFDEAAAAANQALALNHTVNDYQAMLVPTQGAFGMPHEVILRPRLGCEEDLFYMYSFECFAGYGPEAWNAIEAGHAFKDKMTTDYVLYDYALSGMSMGAMMTGLPDYVYTYDMSSGWNAMGMRTSQMYLIVAEAEIRKGNFDAAMQALDAVRVNRIAPELYVPLAGTVTTEAEAIARLRQTELGEDIYSVYNFIHKKRWNQVSGWEQTFSRTIAGQTYSIAPDSPMWIFPFPVSAVSLNPNLTQNYKEN